MFAKAKYVLYSSYRDCGLVNAESITLTIYHNYMTKRCDLFRAAYELPSKHFQKFHEITKLFVAIFVNNYMKMNKAYKFRLYPNAAQQKLLEQHFGAVRFIYNFFLEQKIKAYKETKKTIQCS